VLVRQTASGNHTDTDSRPTDSRHHSNYHLLTDSSNRGQMSTWRPCASYQPGPEALGTTAVK